MSVTLATCLGGCGTEAPLLPGFDEPPCELVDSAYRIRSIEFPESARAEVGLALEVPPCAELPPFNRWIGGRLLLADRELQFAADVKPGLEQNPWLLRVQSCEGDDHIRLAPFRGERRPTGVAAAEPFPIPAVGAQAGSRITVSTGTGSVPVSLMFQSEPDQGEAIWVEALGVGASLVVDGDLLSGSLAFAVEEEAGTAAALATISVAASTMIANDPGCPTACENSFAQQLLDDLDIDGDGAVSAAELDDPVFRSIFLDSDLDLLDIRSGEPEYHPCSDNALDHATMGIKIEAERIELLE